MFAWAAVVGLGVGVVGAIFRLLVLDASQELALLVWLGSQGPRSPLASIASTAIQVAGALFLVRRYAPEPAAAASRRSRARSTAGALSAGGG